MSPKAIRGRTSKKRRVWRMGRVFNTTGVCVPEAHYMVNIEERLTEIKKLSILTQDICSALISIKRSRLEYMR